MQASTTQFTNVVFSGCTFRYLKEHMSKKHSDSTKPVCPICQKTFSGECQSFRLLKVITFLFSFYDIFLCGKEISPQKMRIEQFPLWLCIIKEISPHKMRNEQFPLWLCIIKELSPHKMRNEQFSLWLWIIADCRKAWTSRPHDHSHWRKAFQGNWGIKADFCCPTTKLVTLPGAPLYKYKISL